MNELLNLAVKAHGGLERWNKVTSVKVSASIAGAIWYLKREAKGALQLPNRIIIPPLTRMRADVANAPERCRAIEKRNVDAIAFGRLFIANPDLVERIREDQPLNPLDRSTFYGGGSHGYTDYLVHQVAA
jgi:2,4-dienoyl-CoA reductase-like NADH-dependent reductase (Old Yellow Enzyme family)